MNLHDNKELFSELVSRARKYFGYQESQIEKDYWIFKVLKELSLSDFGEKVFFKGGTSLSKAYNITKRFSEDLDLFVFSGDKLSSASKEKDIIRKVYHLISNLYGDKIDAENSKSGGNFRKLAIAYDTLFVDRGLKKNLEIEIKCCDMKDKSTMFYPSDKKIVQSFVGQYLDEIGKHDLTVKFGLEAFPVHCLNPRKTICDKISRLTRLSYSENPSDDIAKHIRDIYDLHKILQHEEYSKFLHSKDFLDGMYSVWIEDMRDFMARTHLPLANSPLFSSPADVLEKAEVKDAYETGLRSLLFNEKSLPSLSEIANSLTSYGEILRKFDLYRSIKTEDSLKRFSEISFSTERVDGKDVTYISSVVDGDSSIKEKAAPQDEKFIKQGLVEKELVALVRLRDLIGEHNLLYEKEIPVERLITEEEKGFLVSCVVNLSNIAYPDSELSENEKLKVYSCFSFCTSEEQREMIINEIRTLAEKDPKLNEFPQWKEDAFSCLEDISKGNIIDKSRGNTL